jgi:hypothetical protein
MIPARGAQKVKVNSNSFFYSLYTVSGRKHHKIKIDSFAYILFFFLSADAVVSPKEIKPNRSKAIS